MKKKLFLTVLCFITVNLCAEKFKITNINYDIHKNNFSISRPTQIYSLEQNVSVDKNRVFDTIEELEEYLDEYQIRLGNTRCFEEIKVSHVEFPNLDSEDSITSVVLKVYLKDSLHFLGVPHLISYNSNSGWKPKLKIKDMNFLGTMNELSTDLYLIVPFDSDSTNTEIGSTFSYDYPFKLGIFDSKWINNYTISYSSGDTSPEWDLKTGLILSYPINKLSINFEVYQSAIRNFDYKKYDDEIYFNETAILSTPIILKSFNFLGNLTYKPYLNASFNWDSNEINPINSNLSSPVITLGHSLSASRIDWNNNFRSGFGFTLKNNFSYNIQRQMLYPYISAEGNFYYSVNLWDYSFLNEIGISSRIFAFNHFVDTDNPYFFSDGTAFGGRLRGIRDEQYYSGTKMKACTSISAIIMNLDFPVRIYQTNFSHKLLNYFNLDLQFQPFVDIALTHNKITGKYFDPKDGFYAAGLECLVFPKKWSSFTIRGSLGLDIGKLLLNEYLNNEWRAESSPYEISFGIGLQY